MDKFQTILQYVCKRPGMYHHGSFRETAAYVHGFLAGAEGREDISLSKNEEYTLFSLFVSYQCRTGSNVDWSFSIEQTTESDAAAHQQLLELYDAFRQERSSSEADVFKAKYRQLLHESCLL